MTEENATSRGGTYRLRRGTPPPMEFFREERRSPGARAVRLTLGTVRVELAGLDDRRAEELLRRFGPYVASVTGPREEEGPRILRAAVGIEDREYFIEPPERAEFNPVFVAVDGSRVRYLGYKVAGWFDTREHDGTLLLSRGTFEPDVRAIENYVRVAVAWRAAEMGGALVHAASAVRNGRGYLFYGESGAGKSTLAASTRRATIVSDDLSLVLPSEDGTPHLVGSPFRGTYEGGPPVLGSFPVAAGFRIVQATTAEVRQVARIRALSELVGNLPFVADSFGRRPDLFPKIQATFSSVPLAHLHFRRDDSYWDAIEREGL